MTVTSTSSSTGLLAGNSSNTSWSFSFPVQSSAQVEVVRVTSGALSTVSSSAYSVALTDRGRSGGIVTYPLSGSPVATGESVIIRRNVALTQLVNLRNQGALAPETVEQVADRATFALQQIDGRFARTLQQPDSDATDIGDLPTKSSRAGKYLSFDSAGDPAVEAVVTGVTVSSYAETLLDDTTAGAALTTLGVSSFAQTLLDDTSASVALTTLGVSSFAKTLLDDTSASSARTTLGLGMTLLGDTTASGAATVDFADSAWSVYGSLLLVCSHVVPASSGANLLVRFSVNAGSSYLATGYVSGNSYGVIAGTGAGTTAAGTSGTTNGGQLMDSLNNGTTGPSDGTFWVNSSPGVNRKSFWGLSQYLGTSGGTITTSLWGGYCDSGSTSAVTGVRLLASTGNLSGRFQLFGLG